MFAYDDLTKIELAVFHAWFISFIAYSENSNIWGVFPWGVFGRPREWVSHPAEWVSHPARCVNHPNEWVSHPAGWVSHPAERVSHPAE